MKLISDELNSALCQQLGQEKYNSSLYLYIAGYLKNKGLNNLASHFEEQHKEEFEHSTMIFDLLTDLNSPVVIPEINGVNMNLSTITDVATVYFQREYDTTCSLDAIKKMAIEDSNPVVEEAMRDMIKIQRTEYEEATDFMDKAVMTGNDWKFVMMWDLSLK